MRFNLIALAAAASVGGLLSLPAHAGVITKTQTQNAASACTLSIPTTDTKVRPRANGYRNEGTSNQFVICGMGGYENNTVMSTTLLATSVDGQVHSMSCTGVTGLVGFSGPYYSAKTVTVPATGVGSQSWAAADFGGTPGVPIAGGMNLSVTCTLPPNVALQGFESVGIIDVGN